MNYADFVDPYIGTISPMLATTEPRVLRPYGMAQIVPVYDRAWTDRYWAERIVGFSLFGSTIMATNAPGAPLASGIDHDLEEMKCYRAKMLLEDSGITAEYTASDKCAVFRFSASEGKIYVTVSAEKLTAVEQLVSGCSNYHGAVGWFTLTTDADITADGKRAVFEVKSGTELRIGFSLIDVHQAQENIACELRGRTFDEVANETKDIWNKALGRIEVKGGSEKEKRIFYTSLYRVMNRMVNITEMGKYYDPDSKKVIADERPFYTSDAIWDTFRDAHPLKLLLSPSQQMDEINSYLRAFKTGGRLPSFPGFGGNRCVMIGKHAAQMIVDAWMKGQRDFDGQTALDAMLVNSEHATKIPWSDAPVNDYDACYEEHGFFPALRPDEKETNPYVTEAELRQSVAVTLEVAYDDWCIAVLAKELGRNDIAEKYFGRAKNYVNVFDPETGFMSPKDRNGDWIKPFDPHRSAGPGGRQYFAECNSYTYSFSVQHDIEGLTALWGGKEGLAQRLDTLFSEQYGGCWKYTFLGQYPDATGLIGQFCMGNEPSFHIPYLYNAAGQPWKTQRRVREIMRIWFDDTPTGICGDEDNGAMSAWYVFSAMGFYPTCPGKPVYDIGSPVFDEITLHLENGKTFVIRAEDNAPGNKYIAEATLNGETLTSPTLTHKSIMNGGVLTLKMDARPHPECFQ